MINLREKILIINKLEQGWSIRRIADHLGHSTSTIQRVKSRWLAGGDLTRHVGAGRPKVSTPNQDEDLIHHLRQNPFDTARKAKEATNFPGCRSTACRRIQKSELKNCVAAKKDLLSEEKKQARLIYAFNHIYRDLNFWERVVFTDEKIFQSCNDGHIRVYRPPNTRFDENYVAPANRMGRFSVNVWAWIGVQAPGAIVQIEGRFNAAKYLEILENVMVPSVEAYFPANDYIYQQDNCPVHTAHAVRQWFVNVETLPHPPYSPDLNPIENVWGLLVKKINTRDFQPQNVQELWNAITGAWDELHENNLLCPNLIHSMPRRLQEVIDRNGGRTKY